MVEKKQLNDEELESVNGGSCSSNDEEKKKCISCQSTDLFYQEEGYNFMHFTCNSCGKKWTEDDFVFHHEDN